MSNGLETIALSTNETMPFVMFKAKGGCAYRVTVIPPNPGNKEATVGIEYLTADLHGDPKWVEVAHERAAEILRPAIIVLLSEVEQVYPRDGYEIRHAYKEGCPLSERSFLWRKTRATVVKLWNRRAGVKP